MSADVPTRDPRIDPQPGDVLSEASAHAALRARAEAATQGPRRLATVYDDHGEDSSRALVRAGYKDICEASNEDAA